MLNNNTTQFLRALLLITITQVFLFSPLVSYSATQEFNSSGGTGSTDGLRIYINENTQIQVRRSGSGQVYHPSRTPPHSNLDNGIYLRANGLLYRPTHAYITPSVGM